MKSILQLSIICTLLVACSPKLESHKKVTISSPQTFGIRNFTVLRVDPAGREVAIDWKGYNVRTGSAFNIPFEEIRLSSKSEKYFISDKKAGNNELHVNGVLYEFDSGSQQLLIKFGSGVSIEPGGDYQSAKKQYDEDFNN